MGSLSALELLARDFLLTGYRFCYRNNSVNAMKEGEESQTSVNDVRSPFDSILEAVLTVSPNRQ